jgi:hypothetical protein
MTRSEDDARAGAATGKLRIGESAEVGRLYPNVYFASLPSLGGLTVAQLVEAVLRSDFMSLPVTSLGPSPARSAAQFAAQLVISVDPPHRFDPELSMREPLELQIWQDGTFSVEIEFVGQDIRTSPSAAEAVSAVLAEWADARGWQLRDVFNDRGRSLPDVWNARFVLRDPASTASTASTAQKALTVADAVDFAGRAISVAESQRYAGESVASLLELLRAGEPDGLLGTPATAVFQPMPTPDLSSERWSFEIAAEVCAFANSVHGGLVVLGLEEADRRVSAVAGFADGAARLQIADGIAELIFPQPEGLAIEFSPIHAQPGAGLVLIVIPPQDRVLKPFLVHGAVLGDRLEQQGFSLVERRDTTIYVQGIAALHAQIAAGRALLRHEGAPAALP